MIKFRLVQPDLDKDTLLAFYLDTSEGEEPIQLDEAEYLAFAKQKADDFPAGFVLAMQGEQAIGELVLRIKEYEGRDIGYISFIYLIPECRGKGYSQLLFDYAEEQFRKLNLPEYHLRVAQSNARAQRFYEKQGMVRLAEEYNTLNQRSWRMGKVFTSSEPNS